MGTLLSTLANHRAGRCGHSETLKCIKYHGKSCRCSAGALCFKMTRCHPLICTLWTLFLSGFTQAHPQVVHVRPVENPTYVEEYQCVIESYPEHTKYSWSRQGQDALPEGRTSLEPQQVHCIEIMDTEMSFNEGSDGELPRRNSGGKRELL
ncbi:hypothetical protein SRHO_G00105770 [Serrasalmus rhombeus]